MLTGAATDRQARGLAIIGHRWAQWIVIALDSRAGTRFTDLANEPGLSRRVLAEQLVALEHAGLVLRRAYQRRPQRFDYWLTARGEQLQRLLAATLHVAGGGQLDEHALADYVGHEAEPVPAADASGLPVGNADALQAIVDNTIGAIVRYDQHHRTELVATLQAYLDTDATVSLTAERLFLHRHTVRYRLSRIRELTGLDVDVLAEREQLVRGLRAHALTAGT